MILLKKNVIIIFVFVIIIFYSLPISAYIDNIEVKEVMLSKSATKWIKTIGGLGSDSCYSVQQTADGGYIVAGGTKSFDNNRDGMLIRLDEFGDILWERTFGGNSGSDYCNAVRETTDGGFIIAGFTETYGSGNRDAWLFKTDENGKMIWKKTFGGNENDYGQSVQPTSDGGYMLMGGTSSYGAGDMDFWLIKTDEDGEEQWNKTFGGDEFDYGEEGWQTIDDGYILVGYTYSFGAGESDGLLIKTDVNGNIKWNKTYGGSGDEIANSVEQTSDDGYIISGGTTSDGDKRFDLWLVKTNTYGNVSWNRTFNRPLTRNFGWCVRQTNDGGYIVSGSTRGIYTGYSGIGLLTQVLLLKLDEYGNAEWQRKSRYKIGIGCKVQQTVDGGYIIAGYTGSYGRARDTLLIKTDKDGKPLQKFKFWI